MIIGNYRKNRHFEMIQFSTESVICQKDEFRNPSNGNRHTIPRMHLDSYRNVLIIALVSNDNIRTLFFKNNKNRNPPMGLGSPSTEHCRDRVSPSLRSSRSGSSVRKAGRLPSMGVPPRWGELATVLSRDSRGLPSDADGERDFSEEINEANRQFFQISETGKIY